MLAPLATALGAVAVLALPAVAQGEKVSFLHSPPSSARAGADLVISGTMFGADDLKRARCRYRSPGGTYQSTELAQESGEVFQAIVPGDDVRPPALEYFCLGQDYDGHELQLFAKAASPHSLTVSESPSAKPADPGVLVPIQEPSKPPEVDKPGKPAVEPLAVIEMTPPAAQTGTPGPSKVAILEPSAIPGMARPSMASLMKAFADGLKSRGLMAVSPGEVAAVHREHRRKVPSCGEKPSCLAEAGRLVKADLVIGISSSGAGRTLNVKLVVVAVADGKVQGSAGVPVPKIKDAALVEAAGRLLFRVEGALGVLGADRASTAGGGVSASQPSGVPAARESGPANSAGSGRKPADASESPARTLLSEARAAYESMDYDTAAALSTRALAQPDLDTESRLDAYLVQASSLAITADPTTAEVPFRLLLRARPNFDLPEGTPPKILMAYQKVRNEERIIAEQVQAVARAQLIDHLKLLNEPPDRAKGGRELPFAFRLRDPNAVVSAFEVPFRRQGESAYSVLALKRDREGLWRGSIPAEWTASDEGLTLEYYLVTRDEGGPLLTRGAPARPLQLSISAGS
ncbi:MAG: hypothetical protein HY901_03410, partial [Deltaproteobacteria bacterium]|nr:hypothetical protein [Deltaproteobacteria bacterium]